MIKAMILFILFFISAMHCEALALGKSENIESKNFNFEVLENTSQIKINFPLCSERSPDLNACTPYICKVKAPFGEIFVKVKGMQNDKCQYIERTFGLNGVDCKFQKSDLHAFNRLFAKRFKKLSGSSVIFTDQEHIGLENIFKRECTIVPDYNSGKLISINKINNNELDPEFKIEDLSKYLRIPTPKLIELDRAESVNQEYKADLDNYKSILLRQ